MARAEIAGRALALGLLAATVLLAFAEARSPAARSLVDRTPQFYWLAVRSTPTETAPAGARPPRLTLALYQPQRRTLDLILFPETLALAKRHDLTAAYRSALRQGSPPEEASRQAAAQAWAWLAPSWAEIPTEPEWISWETNLDLDLDAAVSLKARLLEQGDRLRFWTSLRHALAAPGGPPILDRIVLALEWRRLNSRNIRCAWLPEPPQTAELFARLLNVKSSASAVSAPTAEVLNATGKKGMASEVTKVLRSKGVDVVFFGNTSERRRTVVFDRLGSIETARRIADLLGCPGAEPVTQVDTKKLVDVTIVLGEDCAWN